MVGIYLSGTGNSKCCVERLIYHLNEQAQAIPIEYTDCVGCGECSRLCPMKNITMHDGKPVPGNRCTMCYRCISKCPKKAITLIGKQVHELCRIERCV